VKSFPSHVAIVGCGFTGTSAFYQLVERASVRKITIFEASGEYGPGYAYDPSECADYLINNTTDTMCLGPNNRRAFLDWLETHADMDVDLDPKGHLPRSVFGLFLKDVVERVSKTAAEKEMETTFISAEVTRVEERNNGGVILHWTGGHQRVDAVIMATGRCPDIDFCVPAPVNASLRYFHSHLGSGGLDGLPMNADVHILGASLSAYDIVNRLYSDETGCCFERDHAGHLVYIPGPNKRTVTLCSRSGRLKKAQSRTPRTVQRSAFTNGALAAVAIERKLNLKDIADAIICDVSLSDAQIQQEQILSPFEGCASAEDVNARASEILESDIAAAKSDSVGNFLVNVLNDAEIDMWDGFAARLLSLEAEQIYRASIETVLLSYAAPCPIPTAERLLALQRAGSLRILRGVGLPILSASGSYYNLEHEFGAEQVKVLINATGKVDSDVLSRKQPAWVRQLVKDGMLKSYVRDGVVMNGAEVEMDSFRPPALQHVYFANMLLWGPGLFTSSAFIMATIVSRIIDHLFGLELEVTLNEI
jgi:uncharacterized NAD(P)/FAD-binding protein YdhS